MLREIMLCHSTVLPHVGLCCVVDLNHYQLSCPSSSVARVLA